MNKIILFCVLISFSFLWALNRGLDACRPGLLRRAITRLHNHPKANPLMIMLTGEFTSWPTPPVNESYYFLIGADRIDYELSDKGVPHHYAETILLGEKCMPKRILDVGEWKIPYDSKKVLLIKITSGQRSEIKKEFITGDEAVKILRRSGLLKTKS